MQRLPLEPIDALGRKLKPGDMVRVIGVPELNGMSEAGLRESLSAFRHLVGTYRKIRRFDQHGFAEIFFRVQRGPIAGWHGVTIEPFLLRRKRMRRAIPRRVSRRR